MFVMWGRGPKPRWEVTAKTDSPGGVMVRRLAGVTETFSSHLGLPAQHVIYTPDAAGSEGLPHPEWWITCLREGKQGTKKCQQGWGPSRSLCRRRDVPWKCVAVPWTGYQARPPSLRSTETRVWVITVWDLTRQVSRGASYGDILLIVGDVLMNLPTPDDLSNIVTWGFSERTANTEMNFFFKFVY